MKFDDDGVPVSGNSVVYEIGTNGQFYPYFAPASLCKLTCFLKKCCINTRVQNST